MEFWETEYSSGGSLSGGGFDWFFEFEDVSVEWWRDKCGKDVGDLVVLGCGHSSLSRGLQKEAYPEARVVSVDSSATCVALMREKEPGLEWHACDARSLRSLPGDLGASERYDAAVDKGCLDALLGYGSEPEAAARDLIAEAGRVLRENGRFVVVACTRDRDPRSNFDGFQGGKPACVRFFDETTWTVEVSELPAPRSDRGVSPAFDDVRPKAFAVVVAVRKPRWGDYIAYYRGDMSDGAPPEPHDAFVSFDVLEPYLAPLIGRVSTGKKTVLEVGCGNSPLGHRLTRRFPEVAYLGVDVVPEAVDRQRRAYPELDFRVADARRLVHDLAENTDPPAVDLVFDKGTADALFLYDPGTSDHHVQRYLKQVADLLRPGGCFVVAGCARTDGILHGAGAPRLWANVAQPAGWRLDAHHLLHSDVGAGDRSFDFLVLSPPPPPLPTSNVVLQEETEEEQPPLQQD